MVRQTAAQHVLTAAAIALCTAVAPLAAQAQPQQNVRVSQPRAVGSVTGTVFFGDTQRPARFATVQLFPVSSAAGGTFRGGGGGAGARTALDGTFFMENVEAGDYYVSASATGYIAPATEMQALIANGATEEEAARKLTIVHVAQGAPSNTSLTLERGAVLAGTVLWDDGTPAAGVQVLPVATTTTQPGGGGGRLGNGFGGNGFGGGGFRGSPGEMAVTDDRGHFRVMGIAPGEYYVRASVQAPIGGNAGGPRGFARSINLTVFAPGKLRRTEAETVKLSSAEEHDGVSITLNLRALHTVSGQISATTGGSVTGGQVRVVDSSDSSLSRFGEIGSDGSFSVPYVPSGTYTMTVNARTGGNGNPGQGGFTPGQGLQPLQQTLAVVDGDISGLTVTVTPATTASAR